MARNLYEILGVSKDATEDAIRKAFRKLAAKYHPDRNPGKDAEAKFKEINRANEVLSDKTKRALYDEFGDDSLSQGFDAQRARAMRDFSRRGGGFGAGGGRGGSVNSHPRWDSNNFQDLFGGGGGDLNDLFGDAFARQNVRARPRKAPDMEAEVSVDFVSAIQGTTVELHHPNGDPVTVRIPPGVSDGGRLRIVGQGSRIPNAQPGDLLLTVKVDAHPYFRREADDLHLDLPITVVEAYEGAKVRVPTPTGEVQLKVPPRTQSGQVSRLRGRGVTRKGKPAGDLYVRFLIRIPETDDPAVERAMDELRNHLQDPRAGIRF